MQAKKNTKTGGEAAFITISWYKLLVGVMWLFFVIGTVLAVIGGRSVFEAYNSKSWPPTTGIIKDVSYSAVPNPGGGVSHAVDILYEYIVDGQKYTSHRLDVGVQFNASKTLSLLESAGVGKKYVYFIIQVIRKGRF